MRKRNTHMTVALLYTIQVSLYVIDIGSLSLFLYVCEHVCLTSMTVRLKLLQVSVQDFLQHLHDALQRQLTLLRNKSLRLLLQEYLPVETASQDFRVRSQVEILWYLTVELCVPTCVPT